MSEQEFKSVFSKNLQYFMKLNNETQMDLMNFLELPSATVSSWVNGARMPRMNKVQVLANHFGIEKSALLEDWQSAKKNTSSYTEQWNALSPEEREQSAAKTLDRWDLERQNSILNAVLSIAESAGPDYLDFFIDDGISDYRRCEKLYNLFVQQMKSTIDLINSEQ